MKPIDPKFFLQCLLAAAIFVAPGRGAAIAAEWEQTDSPYRLGEAYPETPATCETVNRWIDHAPQTDDRVSMGIVGELSSVEWDGTLAYLIMCKAPGVRVLCVTYSRNGLNVGDRVLFGGGYARAGEKQIMLDPCLATRPEKD